MERLSKLNNHVFASATASEPNQFGHIAQAPADPILQLTTQFKADKFEKKVNLGVGAYRDDNGKPFVFPIVRKVE